MDGITTQQAQESDGNASPFSLAYPRPQQWSVQGTTNFDPQMPNLASNYTFKDPSFTQQMNSIEVGPDNEIPTQPSWTSAAPPFTSQPVAYNSIVDPQSYTTSAPWTSTNAPAPNHWPSKPMSETLGTPAFLGLGSFGADAFNPECNSENAYPFLGIRDEKSAAATLDFQEFESDFGALQDPGAGSDEHNTIIDLSHFPNSLQEPIDLSTSSFYRRRSSSSFVSTIGPMMDPPDLSSCPDSLSYASDGTPQSSLNLSSTSLSPVQYSRRAPQEMVRSSSQGKATPSPRPSMRAAPYPMDAIRENQTSTASITASAAQRPSPCRVSSMPVPAPSNTQPRLSSSLPSSNLKPTFQCTPFGGVPRFHQPIMPPSAFDPASRVETVPYMLSNGTFRTLESNAIPGSHVHDHFCDHGDPPDLFAPLSDEQLVPPLGDMKPDDAELIPHEQELRFEGDLYTPRFVRGHGNKREGWCGICKPGRWLVLKNSAYWYDKSFSHGVSAASGQAFEGPRETRRMDGNADVWEGLCGSCQEWIALVSSKKKGTTWFRHAYKCHTHSKVKDAPKRRRESHPQGVSTPSSSMAMPARVSGTLLPNSSLNAIHSQNGRIETVAPFRPVPSMMM